MLPATLGRHVGHSALQNFQQCLLHALAGHIPGNGGILALTGDFVHLVDVDDATLCQLHIEVGCLQKAQENILHVLAHVTCLGEGGGVCDGKGHIEDLGQSLGKEGLARACGANEQDIALLELHIGAVFKVNALIMVIDRYRQGDLGVVLADDVVIHIVLDFLRRGQGVRQLEARRLVGAHIVPEDAGAQLHALVADIDIGSCDDPVDLLLPLAAEGAADALSSQGELPFRRRSF